MGISPFEAGLTCRCPRCGKAPLFEGLLKVRETCPSCGLDLSAQDSGDGPAIFVILILGAILVPLALWVEFTFEPPPWLHMVLWLVVGLAGAIAMMRPLKATLIALQFKHRPPS